MSNPDFENVIIPPWAQPLPTPIDTCTFRIVCIRNNNIALSYEYYAKIFTFSGCPINSANILLATKARLMPSSPNKPVTNCVHKFYHDYIKINHKTQCLCSTNVSYLNFLHSKSILQSQ